MQSNQLKQMCLGPTHWDLGKQNATVVKTHSMEPPTVPYIGNACLFPRNNLFIQMNFWMKFVVTCYEKWLELLQ
jgi:hypothetical protein